MLLKKRCALLKQILNSEKANDVTTDWSLYSVNGKIKQQYLLDEVETSDDEWDEEEVDLGEN